MIISTVEVKTYKMELTEKEATALKGYMQNNMYRDNINEPADIFNIRSLIFKGLEKVGVE